MSKRMLSAIVFSISWQFRDVVAASFCVRVCGANMIHRESIFANGENAWWKFHFRFGISLSLVWFFFARLCLLWNCCHFANSCACAYLIRFMHWTISRKKILGVAKWRKMWRAKIYLFQRNNTHCQSPSPSKHTSDARLLGFADE